MYRVMPEIVVVVKITMAQRVLDLGFEMECK